MTAQQQKEEIEKLTTQFFDELEYLNELREQYNELLKNGYFYLAKSRYSMGLKSLGQLQYPENIKSTFTITIDSDNSLSIHERQDKKKSPSSSSNNTSSSSSSTTTTTKRRGGNKESKTKADSDDESSDDESENNNNNQENNENNQDGEKKPATPKRGNKELIKKDPIYWFGIMTPSTLKQSQSYFKQSINLSLEMSNKIILLNVIEKQLEELKKNQQTV
ncbi:hypothetical protein CYY_005308 [Polysphondylium violaceum]|uniref:Vacuolar ATPase assembly protein VMA22 n=1 Tax=Polysphondylium violaceum TaxID=133409 RepID=A0A8J4UYQ6_9MYCE|nr:hypothetical protein CYY_005308 [Polysphondylium violaceum]